MGDLPTEQVFSQNSTSMSPAFSEAFIHAVTQADSLTMNSWYALGESSYFSESSLFVPGNWKMRYWGRNYEQLLAVKQKYDDRGVFWCNRCVGSDVLSSQSHVIFT